MARRFGDRLGVVVISFVDALLVGLRGLRFDHAGVAVQAAQRRAKRSGIGHILRDDVARTRECRVLVGHFVRDVFLCQSVRVVAGALLEQPLCQRLKTLRARDARAGLALGAVGAVDVLHLRERLRVFERGRKFVRPLALFLDGRAHGLFLRVELAQVLQPLAERAQRAVVHAARGLLAVAGDERDGVALVDEFDGRGDAALGEAELGCDDLCVCHDFFLLLDANS